MDEALQKSGLPRDPKLALQWAMHQHGSQQIVRSKQQAERRRYMWDGQQRNIDRVIDERRHSESMSVAREDRDWLSKLEGKRDKALIAISRAIFNGLAATVFLRLAIFTHTAMKRLNECSLSGLVHLVSAWVSLVETRTLSVKTHLTNVLTALQTDL